MHRIARLLPETSVEETENYVREPKITILENSSKVQAVYHRKLGITGINFWQEQGGSIGGITSDKSCFGYVAGNRKGNIEDFCF